MKTENIEDIYELSSIQKGILFHSLHAPEFGLYFFQMPFVIRGNLNLVAFERAWQEVAARHTILRTGFHWKDINKPLQVVYRQVKVPLQKYDWRGINLTEQQQKLKLFLESDRHQGFDMSQDCLMRLSLIQLANELYQFVWSRHFIVLDGWSIPVVLKEVVQIYEALCQDKEVSLPPSIPYRNYIDWLQQQDISKAEAFWRKTLSGLKAPTSLNNLDVENLSNQEERYEEQRIYLSTATTTALQSLARQHQLTLSTIFQGAWAILLSYYSGEKKVLYGCTVAGRPVELVTEEPLLGLFVNSLPVWVNVDAEQSLLVWLKQLQEQLVEMRQYEWAPDVQFPIDYLPKWYADQWWRYCQFFIGASNSLTPLHFDCLLTNNLFFQIVGRKQFTIFMHEDEKYCYRYNWRWFKVNPENPDLDKYPQYKNARPIKTTVNPGDILYMPPGTLHHVRSLDMSISFNIDWHTNKSVINGLTACLKGMPPKNVYYNFLLTLGLVLKVPPQVIFNFYKTYLNYIS